MSVTTRIVRIGNSRGIRVPKALLDVANLPEEIVLDAEAGRLVVTAVRATRAGWAEAAQRMHEAGDDQILDQPSANAFDDEEWER